MHFYVNVLSENIIHHQTTQLLRSKHEIWANNAEKQQKEKSSKAISFRPDPYSLCIYDVCMLLCTFLKINVFKPATTLDQR